MKAIKWTKVTLVALMAICLCSLAACGGGSDKGGDDAFVGSWAWEVNLADMGMDGLIEGMEDAQVEALMEEMGLTMTMTLADDKSVVMEGAGQSITGTWEAKDDKTVTITLEGDAQDAVLTDGKLVIEMEGMKMTFKKV